MKERLHVICGHFGSGKSEISVNLALKYKEEGYEVAIVDLDIVNPYFRTNDVKAMLENKGIEVIAPEFAGTNLDMPTVPRNIMKVFNNTEKLVIFDVGGDEDGAYALGRYKEYFDRESYRMYLVVNAKRPLTGTKAEILEMADEISKASRLKITDVINNTNIGSETDENTIFFNKDEVEAAAEALGTGVTCYSGLEKNLKRLSDVEKLNIDIQIKMPWEGVS